VDRSFYFEILYPFQDQVLALLSRLETGFYLTGGTASSRGYLNHRFSDDLDLFVNDRAEFSLWANRLIEALSEEGSFRVDVRQREERFVRLILERQGGNLKVEMVNDVPSHIGEIRQHPILGRLDSPENILANKITALVDREEPKDLADIWGFCCKMDLSLETALVNADSKAAGIFPADIARLLCSARIEDWKLIRWNEPPDPEQFVSDLNRLGEGLVLL
jgi:predicted nucleotidyltransferase component of viral defense system